MNNCTSNFTTPSTFSTTQSIGLMTILNLCLHCFNLLVGLPTHSYVIWLINTGTGRGVASEFFILNLSVCEIPTCLSILLHVLDRWFSSFMTFKYFIVGFGVTGRPLFQCLMCVERYLAVVHPVTFLKYKPLRYRVICCTAVWIITLGSCLCCMFTIVSNIYIYICFYSIQFLLFLSIQLFCCLAVLRALKQSGPGERGREREEENHMKKRAFYLILITTVSMIIIYMPYAVSGFFFILTNRYIQETFIIGFYFYLFGGFVQPFLYLNQVGKFSCKTFNCLVFRI